MADGASSLHALCKEGLAKAIDKVVKADPRLLDARDNDGMAPIHYAAWHGHVPCVTALLAHGAKVDVFDYDGATALHAAAFNNQPATLLALLEGGADATISDNDGHTARETAAAEGHREIAVFLREVEEEQHNARALKQLETQLAELKDKIKAQKASAAKALRDMKKHLSDRDKQIKELAKKTMLRERKERRVGAVTEASQQAAAGTAAQFERGGSNKPGPGLAASASIASHGGPAQPPPPSTPVGRTAKEVDMMLAEFEADGDDAQAVDAFMASLDLREFARVLHEAHLTLDALRTATAESLAATGLPPAAVKRIVGALAVSDAPPAARRH